MCLCLLISCEFADLVGCYIGLFVCLFFGVCFDLTLWLGALGCGFVDVVDCVCGWLVWLLVGYPGLPLVFGVLPGALAVAFCCLVLIVLCAFVSLFACVGFC